MSDDGDKVAEAPAAYGRPRRMPKKPVVITQEEMKLMDPPVPAEPEWMAELRAAADKRGRVFRVH